MKRSRINEMSMEVTVGAFMFMVLLALGVFTIILSGGDLIRKNYTLTAHFEDVLGLREGDNAYYRGVKVGKVKELNFIERGVEVILSLSRPIELHEDYDIKVLTSSVLGVRYISIEEGSADRSVVADNTILKGSPPVDFIEEATKTIKSVNEALDQGGIINNLELAMSDMQTITERIRNGEGTVGRLLKEESIYEDLQEITINMRSLSQSLASTNSTLAKLVSGDDKLFQSLQTSANNLALVSQRVADGKGTVGRLLSEDDTLYEDLAKTATSLRSITESINKGEGTFGKLAKDDQLYNEAQLLLNEVRATVDDLRETAPITTFTSVFFGAF